MLARHGDRRHVEAAYDAAACIVTTPESLEVELEARRNWLLGIRYVVLDELHSVHGTARGTQLRCLLTRLAARVQQRPLVVGLSATVADEGAIAEHWGRPGAALQIVGGAAARGIRLSIIGTGDDGLRGWLGKSDAPSKALVFANSRNRCDDLFLALKGASDHVPLIHYSDLDRSSRHDTEELLRRLPRVACIATSTLELGIDVGDVDAVVLADPPWSTLSALQRVGRGNRRRETADGIAFPGDDRGLLRTLAAFTLRPDESDDDGVIGRFNSVVVQQLVAILSGSSQRRLRVASVVTAFADAGLQDASSIAEIFDHLLSRRVIAPTGDGNMFELTVESERLLGRDHWGNFPVDRAGWALVERGSRMASVRFAVRPAVGKGVLFAGRTWRIVSVRGRTLNVALDASVVDPLRVMYADPSPAVSALFARAMARSITAEVPESFSLDRVAAERLKHLRGCLGPSRGANPQVPSRRGWKIATFAGSRANRLLSLALPGAIASDEVGVELHEPLSAATWRRQAPRALDIDAIGHMWSVLADNVSKSIWFEYLPPELQQDEVVSQFVEDGVMRHLEEAIRRDLQSLPDAHVTI